jgi:hypothetical protein
MSKEVQKLERLAIEAHARRGSWAVFHQRHAEAIRCVEPHNRERYRRLCDRLMHLVICGNLDGMTPPGDDEPWLADDAASKPSDTQTCARCLLPKPQAGRVLPLNPADCRDPGTVGRLRSSD